MDRPFLTIRTPEGTRRVEITDRPITVGRHPENVVVVNDTLTSRYHCVIQKTGRGLLVKDLGSSNGTRINGDPIGQAILAKDDVLSVGSIEIQLTAPNGRPAPQRPGARPDKGGVVFEDPDDDDEVIDLSDPQNLAPPRRGGARPSDDGLIAVEDDGADDLVADIFASTPSDGPIRVDFGAGGGSEDDERFLPVLAGSLPDKPFDVEDVGLMNARGGAVHAAADRSKNAKKVPPNPAEAVTVLRYVLLICARGRGTDIHLEPKSDDFALRLRIDGNMIDVVRISKNMGTRLSALIKILCEIDLQHRNTIQEGHFTATVPGRKIDYRVSFAPSMFGQKLVIRVLDASSAPLHLSDMQMPLPLTEELQQAVRGDSGMILVCGPTGSGKTTTLYSLLRDCGTEKRNVITIEDPIEIEIPGVTQIPVNEEQGNSFAALLRSMLRQDPDVMMVGEVRDAETARIAMQAAMTGHLVLSTIHARDTVSSVFRLLDLGVEPYLVASSCAVIVSQRLARLLCPYCKKAVRPTPQQLEKLGKRAGAVDRVFVPNGCARCLRTGYAGRRGFFEMLVCTDEVRDAIQKSPTPKDIEIAASGHKFVKLSQTGYQLVAAGLTAFDEIERAVGR